MTLVKFNHKPSPVFSRMWDDFFNEVSPFRTNEGWSDFGKVNVVEQDDAYRLEVAAPGLEKGDFEVKIDKDVLTIRVHKEEQEEKEGEKYTRREFRSRSFERSFTLPEIVDAGNIKAQYDNGILNVRLPKREEAVPDPARLIDIE